MEPEVDFTRPLTTRDGRNARILCTDAKAKGTPVIGLIDNGTEETLAYFTATGKAREDGMAHPSDLINAPHKAVRYINVYLDSNNSLHLGPSTYDDRASADNYASSHPTRVGCLRIEVPVEARFDL